MDKDIRWKQRFSNFEKAYGYFQDSMESNHNDFNIREKMGVIQEFEVLIELSWKLMKDYMEYEGVELTSNSPKNILKNALKVKIIQDERLWMSMISDRNIFAHAYSPEHFDNALSVFKSEYYKPITKLHRFFENAE